jgi:hypothetical protein
VARKSALLYEFSIYRHIVPLTAKIGVHLRGLASRLLNASRGLLGFLAFVSSGVIFRRPPTVQIVGSVPDMQPRANQAARPRSPTTRTGLPIGQERRFERGSTTSALPPKVDVRLRCNVRREGGHKRHRGDHARLTQSTQSSAMPWIR